MGQIGKNIGSAHLARGNCAGVAASAGVRSTWYSFAWPGASNVCSRAHSRGSLRFRNLLRKVLAAGTIVGRNLGSVVHALANLLIGLGGNRHAICKTGRTEETIHTYVGNAPRLSEAIFQPSTFRAVLVGCLVCILMLMFGHASVSQACIAVP